MFYIKGAVKFKYNPPPSSCSVLMLCQNEIWDVLFWDFTQHGILLLYGLFGQPISPKFKGQSKMEPIGCPKTSIWNYYSVIPKECRSYLHCGGSLKSHIIKCIHLYIFGTCTLLVVVLLRKYVLKLPNRFAYKISGI
jgi:hypothetical protein